MSDDSPLIQSLRAAVAAAPGDVPLRLHLAELLLTAGRQDAAVAEVAVALQHAPGDPQARELMARAMGAPPQP
ncbi:tetratricopeptide repeat protein, partial [Streptomyces sp. NPDC000941]